MLAVAGSCTFGTYLLWCMFIWMMACCLRFQKRKLNLFHIFNRLISQLCRVHSHLHVALLSNAIDISAEYMGSSILIQWHFPHWVAHQQSCNYGQAFPQNAHRSAILMTGKFFSHPALRAAIALSWKYIKPYWNITFTTWTTFALRHPTGNHDGMASCSFCVKSIVKEWVGSFLFLDDVSALKLLATNWIA